MRVWICIPRSPEPPASSTATATNANAIEDAVKALNSNKANLSRQSDIVDPSDCPLEKLGFQPVRHSARVILRAPATESNGQGRVANRRAIG